MTADPGGADPVVDPVEGSASSAPATESAPTTRRRGSRCPGRGDGAFVSGAERGGRHRILLPADSEAGDPRKFRLFVQVEHAFGGVGTPLAHGIEEEQEPGAAFRLGFSEAGVDGAENGGGIESEPRPDFRRNVNLGVRELPGEILSQRHRGLPVIGGGGVEPAAVGEEAKEGPRLPRPREDPLKGLSRPEGVVVARGDRHERFPRHASFEVEMEIG